MSIQDHSKADKAMLAEQAYSKAFDYELDYGCCPQCVLAAVKETVGIVTDETIKASHDEYAAFGQQRGDKCARASAQVAKRVVEVL